MGNETIDPSLHFLIVDDDAESRATVVEYLRSSGYSKMTLAHDGAEALRALDHDPSINFIISDWDMPMMNGFSLLQRVKLNANRTHIPFLVMTSPISEEAEKVVLAAENMVDGYLIKPFRNHILSEKIKKILTLQALGKKKKIVLVDDDPDAREMMKEYLNQIGFPEIMSFESAKEAIKYIKKSPEKVGLIISDWEMPEMTGIDLLRLCKGDKKVAEIPFLMVTSQTSIERMKIMQAARANVDQYLLKPFNAEDFKDRIEGVLEKAKSFAEVKKLTLEGSEHLENGRFQSAFSSFEQALQLQPENEIALRGMGDVTLKMKGPQAAVSYYKKSIDSNPVNPKTYLKLATCFDQLGWSDKAIALLQTAIKQVGFNADLHFALGKIYSKKNMYNEAISEFEQTLEIQLDHQEARLMLEMIKIEKKESQS